MSRRAPEAVAAVAVLAASLATGCQFRLNPDYLPPAGDPAPGAVSPAADLSSATDDLAPPATTDLGALAPADLSSPCTRIDEALTGDPGPRWSLMGDASADGSGLQLTSLGYNAAGSAFYAAALPSTSFDASFDFRIWDGSGADGLALVFARAPAANTLTPFGNGVVNAGYGLGYLGMDGFAVEIDTFLDVGNGDPSANHVALVRTSDGAHLVAASPAALLRSAGKRTAHVRLTATHLTIDLDGATALDAELPAAFVAPAAPVYVGFTAASSALDDHHTVSNLHLVAGPPGACF